MKKSRETSYIRRDERLSRLVIDYKLQDSTVKKLFKIEIGLAYEMAIQSGSIRDLISKCIGIDLFERYLPVY